MNTFTSNSFSFARVIQLCRRYMIIKKKMIQIGLAVIIGLLLVMYITMVLFDTPANNSLAGGAAVSVIAFFVFKYAGYALTSTMFNELNNKGSASFVYTLPATNSEKLFSAWLFSFLSYTVVGITALYVFTLILGLDGTWFFSQETFAQLLIYILGQSVYFLGAVYFRNNNFLSTFLVLIVFGAGISLFLFFIKEYFPGFEAWTSSVWILLERNILSSNIKTFFSVIAISSLFMWMSHRKLKTRQIA